MRYKFRAWDHEIGEFVYSDKTYDEAWFEFKGGILKAYALHGMTSGSIHEPPQPNCVELEPPEMFTGLTDRNSKEIWESDLLQSSDGSCKYKVIFDEGAFWAENIAYEWYREADRLKYDEVIGNIYEHSHLLEK